MLKKQSLWFITLFSIVLVLSIYYLTMKDTDFKSFKTYTDISEPVSVNKENSYLVSLRVENDEETLSVINNLEGILNNNESTVAEKSEAYENLKALNSTKSKEKNIESQIKEKYNLDSFVKINGDKINVTIGSDEHNVKLANEIIKLVQGNFDVQKYITVKFKNN